MTTQNQTSWLVHSWNIFGVRTNHEQTRIHKNHHDPNLGEATTFTPYNILYASPQSAHPNGILFQDSQVGVLKLPKLGFPQLWNPITCVLDVQMGHASPF